MNRLALSALTLAWLAACSDDDTGRPDADAVTADAADVDPTDTTPDTMPDAEPDGASDDADAGADDAAETTTTPDVSDTTDTSDVEVVPVACEVDHACNALLLEDGLCPGACFPVPDAPTCKGQVVNGLCYRAEPANMLTEEVDYGDFRVIPLQWPAEAVIGETYPLQIRVANDTANELSLRFGSRDPSTFAIANASWVGLTELVIPASGHVDLTADVTALRPTVFFGGAYLIVTFDFGDAGRYEPSSVVSFPDTEAIACGDQHFPETWCSNEESCYQDRSFYVSARCCDGVFYPSGQCCGDADCLGGSACVDGKCVHEVPLLGSAHSLPLGHQRIALVLVDSHPEFDDDPCADRFETVKGAIDFATIDAWYDELGTRRFGRPTMDIQWIVYGGIETSDFLGDAPNDFTTFSGLLDTWMADRGCPILGEFDKLIVSASTINMLGYGGVYHDRGNIAVLNPWQPYLIAHELGHAFGATDLYLDLAGSLHRAFDLMGNNVHGTPFPEDGVLWGEIGFADYDRSGVIDIAEFAAFPDTLDVADLTATITTKNTLEVAWRFVGVEAGVVKNLVITDFHLEVPAAGFDTDTYVPFRKKTIVFDATQVDLEALRTAGVLVVGIRATHRFTNRDWQPTEVTLDLARNVPITIAE